MSASKLEYLKRYMANEHEPKKKKVRKVKRLLKNPNIKIFDTNVDLKDVEAGSDCDVSADEDICENAPEVAEIIDDRPLEMRSFKKTFHDSGKSDSDHEDLRRRVSTSFEGASTNKTLRAHHNSSDDESPPRRPKVQRGPSVGSPLRRKRAASTSHEEDSDDSPPRRRRGSDVNRGSDIDSPPRRPRRHHTERREIIPCEVIGGPETVSLRGGKTEEEAAAKRLETEKQLRRKEIYEKWSAGLVQQQRRQTQIEDILTEANKPLARSANDDALEDRLKAMDREGDPMLALLKSKKKTEPGKFRYNGPQPPPNRYNIWPGYRWDGIDRSNGFEAKLMSMKNDRMATEEQAYKWSIEDM